MIRRAVLCVAFLLVVSPALVASGTPSAPKVSQVHSNCYLGAVGIAVDASGVYVAGSINGTLPGQTSAGSCDAFLRKHDTSGNVLWTRQFGTSGEDEAIAIAVDASGAYLAGRTNGALPGQTNAGTDGSFPYDAFVIKYDTSGNVLWSRQFGTSHFDQANGIALDASGVYVAGLTWDALPGQTSAGSGDAFLRKYDASGNVLWTRQFGSSDFDQADNVAVDASGAYVAGVTAGAFPGQTSAGSADAFVIKYDTSGNVLWTRQFGSSSYDLAWGMALDASGAYVAGRTGGASGYEPDPSDDAFVRKYDASGNLLWADQFGSSAADWANWIAVEASGSYVAGGAFGGTLPGQTSAGSDDGFVRKYDASGNVVWTRQFGTSADDQAYAIAVDASGASVAGYAAGALPAQTSTGGFDAFVRKYDVNGNEVWTRQFGTQANANLGGLPGSVPWAIYAAVAAGAAALGSAGGLLWRRRRRSRTPPAQPPPPAT